MPREDDPSAKKPYLPPYLRPKPEAGAGAGLLLSEASVEELKAELERRTRA